MKRIEDQTKHEAVVRKIYADAKSLDWQHCSHSEKTAQYERWLDDKEVGGVLKEWMSGDIRVWIKDGPMKEFARAMAGEGEYARFLDVHPRSAGAVVSAAFGAGWRVRKDSESVKPLGCIAERGNESKRVFWGPPKDLKHLVWAALQASVAAPKEAVAVVVFDTIESPLTEPKRKAFSALALRANVPISFVRV
jgi:hypothetical protein